MRLVGVLVALGLASLAACADRVSNAIAVSNLFDSKPIDVSGLLPATAVGLREALMTFGYISDEPATGCDGPGRSVKCVTSWAPDVPRSAGTSERLHFFRISRDENGGESFGVLVDLNAQGTVLQALGYKSGYWVH